MNNRNKILSLVMFVLMMHSCITYENVVMAVADNSVLIKDTKTNIERIVNFTKYEDEFLSWIELVYPGDTVKVQSRYYKDEFVLNARDCSTNVYFNTDSLDNRYRRKQFEITKQKMFLNKVR